MCLNIQTANNVYCSFTEVGATLRNGDNPRIVKSEIRSYKAGGVAPTFTIEFTMKDGSTISWDFPDSHSRDSSLAKIDIEMNAKDMN